ncbi:MAG: hypothetical protein IKQ36_00100 [Clostridia bacterium]|nr:hypothetical protein [Clostridia bacterium]
MGIKYLENTADIEQAFMSRFVMSWETFQIRQNEWIAEMEKQNYPIDMRWYESSYFWDRMDPDYPRVSMAEALNELRAHSGPVLFMTEKGENTCFEGKKSVDYIAEADASELAERIEHDWYESYRLFEQGRYLVDELPEDLYVFDRSMTWCVVFTHETWDWEAESTDMMKAAESRYCIICK